MLIGLLSYYNNIIIIIIIIITANLCIARERRELKHGVYVRETHAFSLVNLRFALCSRDLDVLRAQRIIGFFILLPTNQRGQKIQSHGRYERTTSGCRQTYQKKKLLFVSMKKFVTVTERMYDYVFRFAQFCFSR